MNRKGSKLQELYAWIPLTLAIVLLCVVISLFFWWWGRLILLLLICGVVAYQFYSYVKR